jgi:hypothetical protein
VNVEGRSRSPIALPDPVSRVAALHGATFAFGTDLPKCNPSRIGSRQVATGLFKLRPYHASLAECFCKWQERTERQRKREHCFWFQIKRYSCVTDSTSSPAGPQFWLNTRKVGPLVWKHLTYQQTNLDLNPRISWRPCLFWIRSVAACLAPTKYSDTRFLLTISPA